MQTGGLRESSVSCRGRILVMYSLSHVTLSQRPSQTGRSSRTEMVGSYRLYPSGTVAGIISECG